MNRFAFCLFAAAFGLAVPSFAVDKSAYKWEKTTFLAPGVGLSKCSFTEPRLLRVVAVHIDLKKSQVAFTGTGRAKDWDKPLEDDGAGGLLNARTKENFPPELCKVRVEGETVTSFFKRMDATAEHEALIAFPTRGTRIPRFEHTYDPWGLYISDGVVVSDNAKNRSPIFVVRKDGTASIETTVVPAEYPDILVAHSGSSLIRRNGESLVGANRPGFSPRIGIGLTADKQQCYIVALDGGSPRYDGKDPRSSLYDLDEAFEALGVTDAMSFDVGVYTALVVRDPKTGEPMHVNPFGSGPESTLVETIIGIYRPVKGKAASAAAGVKPLAAPAAPAKTPEQISAKVQNVRLDAVKEKLTAAKTSPSETTLRGQFRVSVRSSQPRFKRPIANVVALFDIGGMWRYCDVILSDPETSAGRCLDPEHTVSQISTWSQDVTASEWRTVTYGDPKSGFFKRYGLDAEKAKLLCYRIEIWQNGVLVDSYDYGYRQAKRAGVPEDWYLKGKHPGAISYRWPPQPKAK